jgi:hypothetical protein
MMNRQLADFGIHPLIGYLVSLFSFAGLSLYLFSKTEFAGYIFILIALGFVLQLTETKRNTFLKGCFPLRKYHGIRIAENVLVILPFLLFLIYQRSFLSVVVLIPAATFLAFINFSNQFNYTIPTPFYKKPFEFIVGFRSAFFMIFFAYFLTFMSVLVGNFNLGIFSLLLVFFLSASFYANPENIYFVWIYNLSPGKFLVEKIRTAFWFSTTLSLPATMVMGIFFFIDIYILLGFQFLCYIYLATMILAKYSRFPERINLPELAIMAFSLWFPPILLGIIPFFWIKSLKRLKEIL